LPEQTMTLQQALAMALAWLKNAPRPPMIEL
jgi:hypothetical protein